MKTQVKKVLWVVCLVAFFPAATSAQPGPGSEGDLPMRGAPGWRIERIIPDLTGEQLDQLKALRLEQMEVSQDYRNQMGELRARQRTLMSENPINQAEMEKLIEKRAAMMETHQKARLAHQVKVREVLTDEQVVVLNQRMQQVKLHRGRAGAGRCNGYAPGRGQFHQQRPGNRYRW